MAEMRDDLEVVINAKLGGRLGHVEAEIESRLAALAAKVEEGRS